MENQQFKNQQQDRLDEGKELKHETELKDLSQIPKKELPTSGSLLSRVSEGLSNTASTISDKLGFKDVTLEGHEDLDKDVRKQVKQINKEILKQPHRDGQDNQKPSEWANELPRRAAQQAEGLARKISNTVDEIKDSGDLSSKTTIQPNREGPSPLDKVNQEYSNLATKVEETVNANPAKQGTSILGAIQQGIHGVTEKISQGVEGLKQKLGSGEKAEEREDDGTKRFRKVKDEDAFNETVDELKHEKRLEELGQEKLSSNNPFQTLSTGNKEETETRTLGEKIKGGLNDASSSISGKVGEVSQKVKSVFSHTNAPVDKENAQQAS